MISNSESIFNLILQNAPTSADSIRVSCLGYQSISLKDFKKAKNRISLSPNTVTLKDVQVIVQPVWRILQRAVEHTDSLLIAYIQSAAYYREFWFLDKDLFQYSEAELHFQAKNLTKQPSFTTFMNQYQIIKDSIDN